VHFVTFDTNSLYNASVWMDCSIGSRRIWRPRGRRGRSSLAITVWPLCRTNGIACDNFYQQVVSRLRAADVDLYLVGHSHTFSWTKPLLGQTGGVATFVNDTDKVYAKGAGLVQLVNGAGGRTLRPGSYSARRRGGRGRFTTDTDPRLEFGYAQLDVSPTELKVSYVSACDGRVIDRFRITSGASDVLTFRQGDRGYLATADTMLRQSTPFTNLSVSPTIGVARGGLDARRGKHTAAAI